MSGAGTGSPAVGGSGLFTVAEARAFDKLQLASATDYPDASISAKEAEIREDLERICGVNFVPTAHTDEYRDGDGTYYLALDWPRITAISAVSSRNYSTWTAFTADELAELYAPTESGSMVYREGALWTKGVKNFKVTYTAGYTTVPAEIKRAALMWCVTELPTSNIAFSANSYSENGAEYSFNLGDGYNDNWHRIPEVRRAIRMYSHKIPGIS